MIHLLVSTILTFSPAMAHDSFISAMEQAFQMSPGMRKPVMQCQCSVEYLGTKAQGGGVYAVLIKKLD